MEMVLDFQDYYQEIKDNEKCPKIFAEFAEDEAMHATRFRELLHEYQNDYLKQLKRWKQLPASPRTHCAGLRGIFLHFRSCHWAWFRLQ